MSLARYTELLQLAREKLATHDIKKAVSLAVGIVLSRRANLPGAPVDSLTDYYITSVANDVWAKVAWLNECIVIDLDLASETARQFWMMRYHHAYPPMQIPFMSDDAGHFLGRLAGCGHLIPQPEFDFCQANANALIVLINRLHQIVDGVNEVNWGSGQPEAINLVS